MLSPTPCCVSLHRSFESRGHSVLPTKRQPVTHAAPSFSHQRRTCSSFPSTNENVSTPRWVRPLSCRYIGLLSDFTRHDAGWLRGVHFAFEAVPFTQSEAALAPPAASRSGLQRRPRSAPGRPASAPSEGEAVYPSVPTSQEDLHKSFIRSRRIFEIS